MASFTDSFGHDGDVSRPGASTRPFDDDGYLGYDPRLPSQRFDAFTNFADNESVKESADDSSPIFKNPSYGSGSDDVFTSQPIPETPSPPSVYVSGGGFSSNPQEFSSFSPGSNGEAFDEGYVASNGSILPPPSEMLPEEGFALREWRRLNAIQLEEKQKREKELLNQIIDEADEYKIDFYRRRKITAETNKSSNREKEKVFTANQEKFHAEADKNYWKAIAELVPHEVPVIKKRGKKDQEKKASIVVIQGPKPGKSTDLSRMRQILVKLKHNPPPHMKTSPPAPVPAPAPSKDAKSGPNAAVAPPPKAAAVATPPEVVSVS